MLEFYMQNILAYYIAYLSPQIKGSRFLSVIREQAEGAVGAVVAELVAGVLARDAMRGQPRPDRRRLPARGATLGAAAPRGEHGVQGGGPPGGGVRAK